MPSTYTNTTRERYTAEQIAALPEMLTATEAAHVAGVSDLTVRAWARAGKVPARKVGSMWRFPKRAFLALHGIVL